MFQLERKQQLVVLMLAAVFLFGAGYKYSQWSSGREPAHNAAVLEKGPGEDGRTPAEIKVHVDGAVEKPGVYSLPQGARVADALEKAAALPQADLGRLNLAEPLKDGRKVPVPYKQEMPAAGVSGNSTPGGGVSGGAGKTGGAASSGLVNINTAGPGELENLPGIGPSLAGRIVDYREKNGYFTDPEDIKKVSGIGDKKYEQLKDFITVY
ncbi:late competence protein ComEA, DNA receptor [Desulfocucumis palustris]|uniref:Late competence protein ComEA, DNA receptor n=1 Tax=Desulfocucumis palustris TaxID=1898651 RepID=A0A2L2XG26_9FIRM|nr:late competence protein ComEA, DNA receptor [Desulfocucumis palustris]